uniref:DUF8039 domain-containing protein n=1 Tax=Setaria viridis TaxID=4556 RepID=A0A4U6VIP8_SETVI|nr:hypothetical protein SEVIR_3G400800v2 [Setaria viridis]
MYLNLDGDGIEEQAVAEGGNVEQAVAEKKEYFHHVETGGYRFNPENGSIIFSDEIREAATKLDDLVKKTVDGSFMPDRERKELTMALGNPEHPGRCRGKGVIPWKFAFLEHIDSYRSRQRSKADQARQLRELQQQVATSEARMEEIIDECVAIALSKQASQQAAAATSAPHVDVSPTQRRSSVTSTEAVAGEYIEAAAGGSTKVIEKRHPVDIIGRAPCELVTPVRNKLIVVAYGVAEQPMQGQTLLDVQIQARYAKVGVLKLEIPKGDGEKNLEEAIHGWIQWPKRFVRIMQLNSPILGSSPQDSRARSPTPSARAHSLLPDRSPSMSPVLERDPSMSPPPPPTKKCSFSPPPPPPKKNQKKQKEKAPVEKLHYDMTDEESKAAAVAEHEKWQQAAHKRKKSGKSISQLREQSNQSVAPLVVLSNFDKNLIEFANDTNLTAAQLRGEDDIPTLPVPKKWKYNYGKELMLSKLVKYLLTKMYKLHQWYMQATSNGYAAMKVWIGDQHYYRGDGIIMVDLEELYMLYNLDALDKSLISCWVL